MALTIVGKMDLGGHQSGFKKPRFKIENREKVVENLDNCLEKISEKINSDPELPGLKNFLLPDARVNVNDDGYDFCKRDFSGSSVDNEVTKMEKLFADKEYLSVAEWQERQKLKDGVIAEKAMVVFLYKILKDKFIIARASSFDDYKHGADFLIIDKDTGAVICGIDAAYEMGEGKNNKIAQNIERFHGTFVKYGGTIENKEFKRRSLKNVPTFFMDLAGEDLAEILANIDRDGKNMETTPAEMKIFNKLVASIEKQKDELYRDYKGELVALTEERENMKKRQKELWNEFGKSWSWKGEGFDLKKKMDVNKLKINLCDFEVSLEKMKTKNKAE
jgi:hypothetical protein